MRTLLTTLFSLLLAVAYAGNTPCSATLISNNMATFAQYNTAGTSASSFENPLCGNYNGNDFWFRFEAPLSGVITIETLAGSINDLAFEVHWNACNGGALQAHLGCFADFDCGNVPMPNATIDGLYGGQDYYIRVWKETGGTGTFQIRVSDPLQQNFVMEDNAMPLQVGDFNCVQLTADAPSQSGCAWYPVTIDFSQPFEQELALYFGDDNNGADGLAFIYQPNGVNACGGIGQGLGAQGIPESWIIEFDTYNNGGNNNDIAADHIAINTNGNMSNPIFPPKAIPYNIEDGNIHFIKMNWDPSTRRFKVFLDGDIYFSVTYDIVNQVFGGKTAINWGVTAATGARTNQQYLCFNSITVTNNTAYTIEVDQSICKGDQAFLEGSNQSESGIYVDVYTAINGCDSTVYTNLEIIEIEAIADEIVQLPCGDLSPIILDASSSLVTANANISWSSSAGNIVADNNTLTPTVEGSGIYKLTIIDFDTGCSDGINIEVIAPEQPIADAGQVQNIDCSNTVILLDGSQSSTGTVFAYEWTSLDGNIVADANTLNPSINAAGTYTLVVTNTTNNCTDEATVSILSNVVLPDAFAIANEDLTCDITSISLSGIGSSTGNNISYEWTSLDGNILLGHTTLNPVVDQAGLYELLVTDNNTACSQTASVTVLNNNELPEINIEPASLLTCDNPIINLDASNSATGVNYNYQWSTSNGNIINGATIPNPTIDQIGIYELIVSNSETGCTNSASISVAEDKILPIASINDAPSINCYNPTIVLDASNSSSGNPYTHTWTGALSANGNTLMPSVNQAGIYSLLINNTDNGCTATAEINIDIDTIAPIGLIASVESLDCARLTTILDASESSTGDNFTYEWTSTNGQIDSGNTTLNPSVSTGGIYDLAILNTTNGCTTSLAVAVEQDTVAPQLIITPPILLTCDVSSQVLSASTTDNNLNLSYNWSTPDGRIVNDDDDLQVTIDAVGTYELLLINEDNHCKTMETVEVESNGATPIAAIQEAANLNCSTSMLVLDATNSSMGSEFTYTWTGAIAADHNSLTPSINTPGTYTLLVSNTENGCTAIDEIFIAIDTIAPTAIVEPNEGIDCDNLVLNLDANQSSIGNEFAYEWTTPNGQIDNGITSLNPTISSGGIYNLTILNTINTCATSVEIIVDQDTEIPVLNIAPPDLLTCASPSFALDANVIANSDNISYNWTSTDGNILNNTNSAQALINAAGTYDLLIVNEDNHCEINGSVIVEADQENPIAEAGAAQTIKCDTPSIILDASASSTGDEFEYLWTGAVNAGANTLNPTVTSAGIYTLLVTNTENACTAIAEVSIEVDTLVPVALIAPVTPIDCSNLNTILDASQSSTGSDFAYEWTTPNGQIDNGNTTLTPSISTGGIYTLAVLNTVNDCVSLMTVEVDQDTEIPQLEIPQADVLTCSAPRFALNANVIANSDNISYNWTSTDGNIEGDASMPQALINAAGTYDLLVVNEDNHCEINGSVIVEADQENPIAEAGATQTINCYEPSIMLNATNSSTGDEYEYMWMGTIESGATTLTPSITNAGTYTLLVTDTENGCTAIDEVNIAIDKEAPSALIAAAARIDCGNLNTTLDASQSSTGNNFNYEWTTTNGQIDNGNTTLNPSISAGGIYTLAVLNTINGCATIETVEVDQDTEIPGLEITPPNVLTCLLPRFALDANAVANSTNLTYNWTTIDGNIQSDETTPQAVINAAGTYELLVVNEDNHCEISRSVIVEVDQILPIAEAGTAQTITCNEPTITLDATTSSTGNEYEYLWTGALENGATTLTPTTTNAGTYTLLVTDTGNGCTAIDEVNIGIDIAVPTASIAPATRIDCGHLTTILDASQSSIGNDFNYEWTTPNGQIDNGNTTLNPSISAGGIYNLAILNTINGCTTSETITVDQDTEIPQLAIAPPAILTCALPRFALDANVIANSDNLTYNWTTIDGNIQGDETTPQAVINAAGTYELLVVNEDNHCEITASTIVEVDQENPIAEAGATQTITCYEPSIMLNATTSSTGDEYEYLWTGALENGAATLTPTTTNAGTYTLLVTDTGNGCTAIDEVNIGIDIAVPTASIAPATRIDCGHLTTILDASQSSIGNDFNYEWTTPNGQIDNGNTTLNPSISAGGIYNLAILNTINGCTTSETITVDQDTEIPQLAIAPPAILTCALPRFALDANVIANSDNLTYNWTTIDGNIQSNQTTPQAVINAAGTYELLVVNEDNHCEITASTIVEVDQEDPIAEAGEIQTITCYEPSVMIDATASSTGDKFEYTWINPSGDILNNATNLTPTVEESGIYILLVTNVENACTAMDDVYVLSNEVIPQTSIEEASILTCSETTITLNGNAIGGSSLGYEWQTANGNITSNMSNSAIEVDAPGIYTLLVTNLENGCSQEETTEVFQDIVLPEVEAGEGIMLTCAISDYYLNATASEGSNFTYEWTTDDGNITTGISTLNPLVNQAGLYTLIVSNTTNGCQNTDIVNITQNEDIPLGIKTSIIPPLCYGDFGAIAFDEIEGGISPYVYSIDEGENFYSADLFDDLESGIYDLRIQDANGCEKDTSVIIPALEALTLKVDPLIDIAFGESYELTAFTNIPTNEIQSIHWTPSEGLSCTDCLNPTTNSLSTIRYTVTIINENGCEISAEIQLRVDRDINIFIPNAFSPTRKDGINDVFMIFAQEGSIKTIHTFQVFDRWGNQVFQQADFPPNEAQYGWDGLFNEQAMRPAVFTYFAEIELADGRREILEGDVSLF